MVHPFYSRWSGCQADTQRSGMILGRGPAKGFWKAQRSTNYSPLNPTNRNYTTTERECLGLIYAIKKLRPYVEGYKFTALTDHLALKYLRNLKHPTGRITQWALELQQWVFEVLSKMHEDQEDRVTSFTEITDPNYLALFEKVQKKPLNYPNRRIEDGMLYAYRYWGKVLTPSSILIEDSNSSENFTWDLVFSNVLRYAFSLRYLNRLCKFFVSQIAKNRGFPLNFTLCVSSTTEKRKYMKKIFLPL